MTTPSDRDREAAAKIRLYAHYQGSVDGVGVTHRSWNDVREDIATAIAVARAEAEQALVVVADANKVWRDRAEKAEQEAARLRLAVSAAIAGLSGSPDTYARTVIREQLKTAHDAAQPASKERKG